MGWSLQGAARLGLLLGVVLLLVAPIVLLLLLLCGVAHHHHRRVLVRWARFLASQIIHMHLVLSLGLGRRAVVKDQRPLDGRRA
jgi:chromate transport protein ChrA